MTSHISLRHQDNPEPLKHSDDQHHSCSLIGCRTGRIEQTTAEGLRIFLQRGNIQDQTVSSDPVSPLMFTINCCSADFSVCLI